VFALIGSRVRREARSVVFSEEEEFSASLATKELTELSHSTLVTVEAVTDDALLQPSLFLVSLAGFAYSDVLHGP
jgi:hypothetical protein